MFSFQKFSGLYNIDLLNLFNENGIQNVLHNMDKYKLNNEDIWKLTFVTNTSVLIGILFAFIISIVISFRKKWSILNSFIVLVSSFLLHWFDILNWFLKQSLGNFINDLFLRFLLAGIVLSIIGFVIFLSKFTNQLIEQQEKKNLRYR